MTDLTMPDLLEEFAIAQNIANSHPILVTLANCKWQSSIISALAEAGDKEGPDLTKTLCENYRRMAHRLGQLLDIDTSDPRLNNLLLQVIHYPALKEIRATGQLQGEWLSSYADAITDMPTMFRIAQSPVQSSTSLGMTLVNHYADLYALANDFAFCRQPMDIVQWAHDLIHQRAKEAVDRLYDSRESTPIYQNQLNAHRKLFSSAYRVEAKYWKPLLEDVSNITTLYPQGMPLSGVELRFNEQAFQIRQLMGLEHPLTHAISR